MSVYVIALTNISDQEEYAVYLRGFMDVFSKYQGKILAADSSPTIKEGAWPYEKTALLEFPTKEEYERFYHSDDYQALAQHRLKASQSSLVMLKGFG